MSEVYAQYEIKHKVGDVVQWRNKTYRIAAIMDCKHSNWVYDLDLLGREGYFQDGTTIFKWQLDEFHEQNRQQTLFSDEIIPQKEEKR